MLADADPGGRDQQVAVCRAEQVLSTLAGVSAAMPRLTGTAAPRTSAIRVWLLELAIFRPDRISSGWSRSTISSPLARMATRGRRYTTG